MFPLSSRVVASNHPVSSDIAGEAVILELNAGEYYGLNQVGAFIWSLIQQPRSVGETCDAIVQKYAVERERCERDLNQLLNELLAAGLIDVRGDGVEP